MRRLKYEKFNGESVEEALEMLNLNFDNLGITDERDIVSITQGKSATPAVSL